MKRLLALLVILCCCGAEPGDGDDPCAGRGCSEHGACAPVGNYCQPTQAKHCLLSRACQHCGLCLRATVVPGLPDQCTMTTGTDCAITEGCTVHGYCTLQDDRCCNMDKMDCCY